MASAKYHKGKDGYFTARVWDGTYKDNKKHYKVIRSKVSSKDLERKVSDFSRQVEERKNVRKTDILFLDYARSWQTVYKSDRTHNTLSISLKSALKTALRSSQDNGRFSPDLYSGRLT